MNKTVHQSSNHCNWILSLALMSLFPRVFMISVTLEIHALFETRIGCEELPTMMFQQIAFSFRRTARVARCHKHFSTTTFLLSSKITQLDRRPAGTLCRPFAINVSTKLQDCCRVFEKLSKNCVWFANCNESNCSDAQSQVVRTMPSEVVSQKTSQGASHVSVRCDFRRRLSASRKTKCSHVVAWLLSVKEHQSSRFRQNHIDRQLPRPAQNEFVLKDPQCTSLKFPCQASRQILHKSSSIIRALSRRTLILSV